MNYFNMPKFSEALSKVITPFASNGQKFIFHLTIAPALAKIGGSKMESKQILQKIEKIKKEIEADACDLIREKIQQRDLHFQKSGKGFFLALIINKLRRRLLVEMDHILEPILENQKEINLRLLKEIEKIKKSHEQLPETDTPARQEKH